MVCQLILFTHLTSNMFETLCKLFRDIYFEKIQREGHVAQWITRLTTDQAIAGSSPAMLVFLVFYFQINLSNKIVFCIKL